VDTTTPQPARFLAGMIGQTLRYGMPARRRGGLLLSLAARKRLLPEELTSHVLRRSPSRSRPDLDDLLCGVRSKWEDLSRPARSLPQSPPPLAALALQRSAGLTVFVFGDSPNPLVVLKVPARGDDRVDAEWRALVEAREADVAPRPLARVGDARVQEGLSGAPLELAPLGPETASSLPWYRAHAELCRGLARLARVTAKRRPAGELHEPAMERAIDAAPLEDRTKRLVGGARRALEGLDTSVLRHVDTSAQNCLFSSGERLEGLVDWELARSCGAPGFDVWNAGVAYIEHCVGLTKWSQERALRTFEVAWAESPFWEQGRAAARQAAAAGGAPAQLLDELEVTFYARRLGWRLVRPELFETGAEHAARMLEFVCEH
jgi:Phosphotransferase enzyme family